MVTTTVLGTCHHDCPDSCGWIATVEDGVATKLRGNPAHPYSRGELCPKVNRFLDRVYSPDRLVHPLIRSGPKGLGEFRQASWDEALALVAERVGAAVAEYGGETVLPWSSAGTQGLLQRSSLDQRFFGTLGASRNWGSLCGLVASVGTASTLGSPKACDPADIRHSKLAVLWGTNTRLTNRHLWPFVEEARANGATVVVIDPMRTMTAESADWFIQPLPGTDVALMLAVMHVLVRDDHVDHDYVERYTNGFDELAAHVAGWSPERAAAICGLDAAEIERFAGAYGTIRPAFIRTLIGAEHHEAGAMFFRTLTCLPTLVGAWRDLGGGYARSVGAWNDTNVDDSVFEPSVDATRPQPRSLNVNHLGRDLTNPDLDPPIHALFVWNGNPVVTVPNAALTRTGLERDDLFTVVSEQFMTDTARYADVIFPATTQLEQRDVVASWGHLYLGWNEAAIDPLGESVPNTELWRRLARAFGFTDPALFEDDDRLLRSAIHGIDLGELATTGFVRHTVPEALTPYAQGGFATASGRVELADATLEAAGHGRLPEYRPGVETLAGDAGLRSRYPLILLTPKLHTRFLNSSYSHLPKHGPAEGGPFVELHPHDADARGLTDGDVAVVANDRASLTLPVRVGERSRPGVAIVPFGWWGDDHGAPATGNSLTSDELTDWGGGVAYSDTLVEVTRAPG